MTPFSCYFCFVLIYHFMKPQFSIAAIYKDFKEFDPEEKLEYGIFYLNIQAEWLTDPYRNRTDGLPKISSYYTATFQPEQTGGRLTLMKGVYNFCTDKHCRIHTKYPNDTTIYVEVDELTAEPLVECWLKKFRSGRNKSTATKILLLPFDSFNHLIKKGSNVFKKVHHLGIKLGLLTSWNDFVLGDSSKSASFIKKSGMTIEFCVVIVWFDNFDIYDYNSFSDEMTNGFANALYGTEGISCEIIIRLQNSISFYRSISHSHPHATAIGKFLYRWGQENKRMVMYYHFWYKAWNVNIHSPSEWKQNLFGRTSPRLPFAGISATGISPSELVLKLRKMINSPLICSDFSTILLNLPAETLKEFDSYFLSDFKSVLTSYSSPCHPSVILMTSGNFSCNELMPIVNFMTTLKRSIPNLLQSYYVPFKFEECRINYSAIKLPNLKKSTDSGDFLASLRDPKYFYLDSLDLISSKESRHSIIDILESFPVSDISPSFSKILQETQFEIKTYRGIPVTLTGITGVRDEIQLRDCFEYKKKWNSWINFAKFSNSDFVVRSDLFEVVQLYWNRTSNPEITLYVNSWFKNTNRLAFNYTTFNTTADETKFLSNIQDTCVQLPLQKPAAPIVFNLNFSGVTFRLSSHTYLRYSAEENALIFELLHFKFERVEIIMENVDDISLKNIFKSINLVRRSSRHTFTVPYKYFLNIEMSSLAVSLPILENTRVLSGVHLNFNWDDKIRLNDLQHLTTLNLGMSVWYEDAREIIDDNIGREWITTSKYIIIKVNLTQVLNPPQIKEHNETFDDMIPEMNEVLLYEIFDNLRADRFNFLRINSNVTVFLQLQWPTGDRFHEVTIKFYEYLRDFSDSFNYPFFLFEAFDTGGNNSSKNGVVYGWWRTNDSLFLNNPFNYIDKQAELYNMSTEMPKLAETASNKTSNSSFTIILFVASAVVLALPLCGLAIRLYYIQKSKRQKLTDEECLEFRNGKNNETEILDLAYNKDIYEIEKRHFNLNSSTAIGYGNFGMVYKVKMSIFQEEVAVKVPKSKDKMEVLSALRDIKTLCYVGEHENIVKLIGAYTGELRKGLVYITMEFAKNGCLLDHLHEIENQQRLNGIEATLHLYCFYRYCEEISNGMAFLAEKKVVHADLATRNILLSEHNVCKISDFGLSRRLYDSDWYKTSNREPMAWKWMALETLQKSEISIKADVWSLGIVFWEIFSLGETPYKTILHDTTFCEKLSNGLRLHKPRLAGNDIYKKMLLCWKICADRRPNAVDLVHFFRRLKSSFYNAT